MPIYRVTVTERTMKAINYQHRNGATTIDFSGTSLLPNAHGEAKVESKKGYIEIEVEFDQSAAGHQARSRIPHLRAMGDHAGRTNIQPGRDSPERIQRQAERDHRVAGLRPRRDGGALLCSVHAEQPGRDGKRGAQGHEGQDRGDGCQVRIAAERPV